MSRPVYETDQDRSNECAIARALSDAFQCDIHRMKPFYPVDLAAIRDGAVVSFIEYKRRKNPSTKYPTLILSLDKAMKMNDLARGTGKPVLFVVEWDDGIFWHRIKPASAYQITIGGRVDRGDSADVEPVINIPREQMKRI